MVKREEKIDNLRTIAILLVVFGHSIILYSSSWSLYSSEVWSSTNITYILDQIKNIINLIQMPLFFAISGYLFNENKTIKSLLISKTKRLIIPYFCISILYMIPIKYILEYPAYQGKNLHEIMINFLIFGKEQGHLWYLPCLFSSFFIAYFWNNYIIKILPSNLPQRKIEFFSILFTICFILLLHFLSGFSHLSLFINIVNWFIYFEIGYFLKKFNWIEKLQKYKLSIIFLAMIALFLSIVRPYTLNNICSIIIVIYLFVIVPNNSNRLTNFLSKESFGIYLFHSPLIYITFTFFSNSNPVLVIFLNFFIFGCVSVILSVIIEHSPFKFIVGKL